MYPGILGPLSDPLQEVLPALNVFLGLGSALDELEDPQEAAVGQSRTQPLSPQSQRGIRTKGRFRWGAGIRVGNKRVLSGKPAGSCSQQERWWWTKRAPLWTALKAPPKLRISVGFLGMALSHEGWTLFCRQAEIGLVETFRSVIKSCLLQAEQARSVLSVLFCGEEQQQQFQGFGRLLFLILPWWNCKHFAFFFALKQVGSL